MRGPFSVAALLATIVGTAVQAKAQMTAERPADSSYRESVRRLQRGDSTVDLLALRMDYAHSSFYAPISPERLRLRSRLHGALGAQNTQAATAAAESLLALNYADIEGHVALVGLALQARDSARARFYTWVARGLFQSFDAPHRGSSDSAAILVVTPDEEVAFGDAMQLERTGRYNTHSCGSRACDAVVFRNARTGADTTITFDITLIFEHTVRPPRRAP